MMKNVTLSSGLLLVASLAGQAYGGESTKASFTLVQQGLKYQSDSTKVGDADAVKSSSFATQPTSLELWANFGKIGLYLAPLSGSPLYVGYMVTDKIEVGGIVGLNSKTEGDVSASSNAFGFFGGYYDTFGSLWFELVSKSGNQAIETAATETTPATSTKVNSSGMDIALSYSYDYKLSENLTFSPGVGYWTSSSKVGEVKTAANGFSVNLVKLKFAF